MPFCTKCGHKNADENLFCEECGTALKSAAPAATPLPAAAPKAAVAAEPVAGPTGGASQAFRGKTLLYVGAAVCTIAVAGGAAYFTLRAQEPSNALFADLVEKSVAADASAYKARYCLSNFAYDKDPVFINPGDSGTRNWLSILVKAGLYTEPVVETEQNGFFLEERLKYAKTEAGNQATQGRSLCIAEGVAVDKIEGFTPPTKTGSLEFSRATVQFKLRNAMPWVGSEEAKQAANIPTEFKDIRVLVLKDGKWALASEEDVRTAAAQGKLEKQSKATTQDSGAGFFNSLMKFFASSGNPLIGRWTSHVMGMVALNFEFDADSMANNGQKTKVRYEVNDKTVSVYPEGSPVGLVFTIVDANTMRLNTGFVDVELKRAQ